MASATREEVGNLPLDLSSFVGRRREVTETRRLLSVSRLVTLTGLGGVGKTRLALRVAADSRRSFDDGVWVVEFGERHDPQLVPDTVAATLELREQSTSSTTQVLTDYLASRKVLLVLDSCEHLIDEIAELAETLLRSCPGLRILATSREPLAIDGETVLRVPPLTLPMPDEAPVQTLAQYEAVNLFVERAAVAVPGFELTDDNRDAIVAICRELDGLPLAIELAAARLRAMSVDQLQARLTDRFRLLTGGVRTMPDRQRTLRTSIEWSHDLCTPTEQVLWRRLSVFPHGFEFDAIESLASAELEPLQLLDLVTALVDKSILVPEQYGDVVRYRLLESLRDFGIERLHESGEYTVLRRWHRDWYLDLVERAEREWIGPDQAAWLARFRRERASIRDAVNFSLTEPGETTYALRIVNALYLFWVARGLLNEGRLWVGRALAATEDMPTGERAKALAAATVLAASQGDTEEGMVLLAQAREVAAQVADPRVDELVAHGAGFLALYAGDIPEATTLLRGVLESIRSGTDRVRQVTVRLGLAMAAATRDDLDETVRYTDEVLEITSEHGESIYRSYALYTRALTVWREDPAGAQVLLETAIRLSGQVDDVLGAASCLECLAWIAASTLEPRRSAILFGAADTLWQSVGAQRMNAPTLRSNRGVAEKSIRDTLGDRGFETALRLGAGLTLSEMVAFAVDGTLPEETSYQRSATDLTPREEEVAELVAQGLTNREIAEKLVISLRTAQGHVEHVLAKLGFTSRTQIAAWVVARNRQGGEDTA